MVKLVYNNAKNNGIGYTGFKQIAAIIFVSLIKKILIFIPNLSHLMT